MQVTSHAVAFTVADETTSTEFFTKHLGFQKQMSAPGFASLLHEASGLNVIFHRTGLEVLPENIRHQEQSGVILALVVPDIEAELARLSAEGVTITLPLRDEEWGERLFMIADPNGVLIEFVQWATPDGKAPTGEWTTE
ncbi:MAG: glyoxalase [Corynebacteriales bacterium]|nr:glyoxalase [Mycobacteriales bacterium]